MPLLTNLDIINAACARIGEDPVQTLDDDVGGGAAAGLLYEDVVGFNLGIYVFSFAKEIRQLSVDDQAAPYSGYTRVYDLPAERLGQPLYVTDDPSDPNRRFSRYVLVGDAVHSDADPLFAMIRFLPTPRLWSPTFRTVTITALASRLALSLAEDRATSEDLKAEAYGTPSQGFRGGQMLAAINADSFSTPPRPQAVHDNPLTRSWRS